jgi:hypothetical protein
MRVSVFSFELRALHRPQVLVSGAKRLPAWQVGHGRRSNASFAGRRKLSNNSASEMPSCAAQIFSRVAEQLGEDEDWLRDVAREMEIEDGVIWIYGVGEDGVLAFTDFGIESLIELIKMHKDDPTLLNRYDPQ